MRAETSAGEWLAAHSVDCRTSTKRTDMETSAPPGKASRNESHALQKCGFRLEGDFPRRRITQPPIPAKGTRHRRQRGGDGRRRCRRCCLTSAGCPASKICCHSGALPCSDSSAWVMAGLSNIPAAFRSSERTCPVFLEPVRGCCRPRWTKDSLARPSPAALGRYRDTAFRSCLPA